MAGHGRPRTLTLIASTYLLPLIVALTGLQLRTGAADAGAAASGSAVRATTVGINIERRMSRP